MQIKSLVNCAYSGMFALLCFSRISIKWNGISNCCSCYCCQFWYLSSFSNNNVAMLVSSMAVVINPGPSPFKISMQTFHWLQSYMIVFILCNWNAHGNTVENPSTLPAFALIKHQRDSCLFILWRSNVLVPKMFEVYGNVFLNFSKLWIQPLLTAFQI